MVTRPELNEFVLGLQNRLDLFQDARRELNLYLASEFNVFLQYFDPDENAISRVLAILLDPERAHGQGAVFLRQFLDMIGHPELCADSRKARVRYQDPATWANESGLIDITIDMGKFGVGIENKPWAGEPGSPLLGAFAQEVRGLLLGIYRRAWTPSEEHLHL
ncbi:MAG TPA: PD-(D/E)XK nuclease family protein [Bryobacteraceae bacterium]|nr:PD-(D/E)XK nuclease family protein [Bryobacteraceae bacterium]